MISKIRLPHQPRFFVTQAAASWSLTATSSMVSTDERPHEEKSLEASRARGIKPKSQIQNQILFENEVDVSCSSFMFLSSSLSSSSPSQSYTSPLLLQLFLLVCGVVLLVAVGVVVLVSLLRWWSSSPTKRRELYTMPYLLTFKEIYGVSVRKTHITGWCFKSSITLPFPSRNPDLQGIHQSQTTQVKRCPCMILCSRWRRNSRITISYLISCPLRTDKRGIMGYIADNDHERQIPFGALPLPK